MRCSRVALSLLLAIFGAAVIALGPADGQIGVAADLGLEQTAHGDTYEGVGDCQTVTDWREDDSTDGEEPSISARWDSNAVNEDGTPAAAAEEDQPESGGDDADEGHPAETSKDVEQTHGHYDEGDVEDSRPEEGPGDEAQVTQGESADEDYTPHSGDLESDWGNDREDGYVSEDHDAEAADAQENDACESDRWSESSGRESGYEEAGESRYSYEPEVDESQNPQPAEPDDSYSHEAETPDCESEEADEARYSYEPEVDDSEDPEPGESDDSYSSEAETPDYESEDTDEARYSYEPDACDSENSETGESDLAHQEYGEAYPEQENADAEDEDYTYQYEYSEPEGKYGYAEGLSEEADDEAGDASEGQAEPGSGRDEGQEDEVGEAREADDGAAADGEYIDPCQPGGYKGSDGHETLEETPGGEKENDWHPRARLEGAVWGVMVSWASRSLEELGDACHSLSRQISGLGGKSWAVGSRQEGTVN